MADLIRLRPDVEWQEVDGEVIVLDLAASAYLSVNGTGARLWPLVVDGATNAQLVDELTSHFPVEPAQARADVAQFVSSLRSLAVLADD